MASKGFISLDEYEQRKNPVQVVIPEEQQRSNREPLQILQDWPYMGEAKKWRQFAARVENPERDSLPWSAHQAQKESVPVFVPSRHHHKPTHSEYIVMILLGLLLLLLVVTLMVKWNETGQQRTTIRPM